MRSSPGHVGVEPLLQELVCLRLVFHDVLLASLHHAVILLHDLLLCGAVDWAHSLLHLVDQGGDPLAQSLRHAC